MASRNQVPNLTPRARAARRRSWIASFALAFVLLAGLALTIYVWLSRAALSS
jgi:hypothetical protein